jgi:hypothetical protein
MAETYRQSFINTSAIGKASTAAAQFIGAFYVSMTDFDEEDKGACNVLNINNASDQDALLVFSMEYTGTVDNFRIAYPLPARGSKNIKLEDGKRFYRFKVMDRNTATDIAAGAITGAMSRVV